MMINTLSPSEDITTSELQLLLPRCRHAWRFGRSAKARE